LHFFSLAIVENLGFGKLKFLGLNPFSSRDFKQKSGNNGFIYSTENNSSIIHQ